MLIIRTRVKIQIELKGSGDSIKLYRTNDYNESSSFIDDFVR